MKIIGKTTGGYILSATEDEIAFIAGFTHHKAMIGAAEKITKEQPTSYAEFQFKPGALFDIGACWARLQMLLNQQGQRERAITLLKNMVEALDLPLPVIDDLAIPPPKGPSLLDID